MVEVKIGTIIKAEDIKSGTKTADGKRWMFGIVKAEKGYDKIQVWASNAQDLPDKTALAIKSIESAKKTAEKYTAKDGTEKWADKYIINAALEIAQGVSAPAGNFETFKEKYLPPAASPVEGFAVLKDEDIPF